VYEFEYRHISGSTFQLRNRPTLDLHAQVNNTGSVMRFLPYLLQHRMTQVAAHYPRLHVQGRRPGKG
jgi:hypothetical protein